MSNVLTELHDKIDQGVTAVEGWIGELKNHLPQVAEVAAKIEESPIVQALAAAVLPPTVEAEIARLIAEASTAFAAHGSATVTGSAGPAEPVPATDQPTPAAVESNTAPTTPDA